MNVSAIILAAGQSKRMGQPKMNLPWENTTVLGRVVETVQKGGIVDILIVTGGARDKVEEIVAGYEVRFVHNKYFESEEMLTSIQLGLREQKSTSEAVLICLGDQPQVEEKCVRSVCEAFQNNNCRVVVPSYQMHRGHPWLIARELWSEVQQMQAPKSMRDFLNQHMNDILYVEVESPSILQDVDTLEDYIKYKPKS